MNIVYRSVVYRILILMMLTLMIYGMSMLSWGQTISSQLTPTKIYPENVKFFSMVPSGPDLNLTSYVILDADSDQILASKAPNERLHPASLTKMMTAYIAETELANGNIPFNKKVVTVSKKAWKMGGSTMFLDVGDQVSIKELLQGIIVVSGNDASVATAEYIAGSESGFVQMMNSMAKKLGMNDTHFVNAAGWPAKDHYSTAHDLVILADHIIHDFPENYKFYKEKYFQYGVNKNTGKPLNRQPNRNSLLWSDHRVDGLKTGHIKETGYHYAVTGKDANGRRVIVVLLGAKNKRARIEYGEKLLNYGFNFFNNNTRIQKKNAILGEIRVWKGKSNTIDATIPHDLIVTVPRGTVSKLKTKIVLENDLIAPIKEHQIIGSIAVTLDNQIVKKEPLLAKKAVPLAGFFARLWDSIIFFFHNIF